MFADDTVFQKIDELNIELYTDVIHLRSKRIVACMRLLDDQHGFIITPFLLPGGLQFCFADPRSGCRQIKDLDDGGSQHAVVGILRITGFGVGNGSNIIRRHASLLIGRSGKTNGGNTAGNTVCALYDIPDSPDMRVAGLHFLVYNNGAVFIHGESRFFRKLAVCANADSQNSHIRGQNRSAGQLNGQFATFCSFKRGNAVVEMKADAVCFYVFVQKLRHFKIKLRHYLIHGFCQVNLKSAGAEVFRHFNADEASSDDDGSIKKAYRREANKHHPDKLRARGLPESMIKEETEKFELCNAAWEVIRQARGIR